MLREIAQRYNIDLKGVPSVGDSLRDLQAAAAVSCETILVKTGKGAQTLAKGGLPEGTRVFDDLAAVAAHYCQ
jgi:D-glycero-D-manno-heptose 1,7-bisphosphate phosphatase